MPFMDRIKSFLSSPQGRKATDQARRMASDPRNQQRAKSFLGKLRGR